MSLLQQHFLTHRIWLVLLIFALSCNRDVLPHNKAPIALKTDISKTLITGEYLLTTPGDFIIIADVQNNKNIVAINLYKKNSKSDSCPTKEPINKLPLSTPFQLKISIVSGDDNATHYYCARGSDAALNPSESDTLSVVVDIPVTVSFDEVPGVYKEVRKEGNKNLSVYYIHDDKDPSDDKDERVEFNVSVTNANLNGGSLQILNTDKKMYECSTIGKKETTCLINKGFPFVLNTIDVTQAMDLPQENKLSVRITNQHGKTYEGDPIIVYVDKKSPTATLTGPELPNPNPSQPAKNNWAGEAIYIEFSEAVRKDTLTQNNITLSGSGGVALGKFISCEVGINNWCKKAKLQLDSSPSLPNQPTLVLSSDIADLAGNRLDRQQFQWDIPAWYEFTNQTPDSFESISYLSMTLQANGAPFLVWSGNQSQRGIYSYEWKNSRWTPTLIKPDSPTMGSTFEPTIETSLSGQILLAWINDTGPQDYLLFDIWNGSKWFDNPISFPESGASSAAFYPSIADVNGDIIATWLQPSNGAENTIRLGKWKKTNGAWQILDGYPTNYFSWQTTRGYDVRNTPALAIAPSKPPMVGVLFTDHSTSTPIDRIIVSKDIGQLMGCSDDTDRTKGISRGAIPLSAPSMFYNSKNNHTYLAWKSSGGIHIVSYDMADSSSSQCWKSVGAVPLRESNDFDADAPTIAADQDGNPLVAWRERRTIDNRGSPGNFQYIYVKKWANNRWVSVGGAHLNAQPQLKESCGPAVTISNPAMTTDSNGNPYVAWYQPIQTDLAKSCDDWKSKRVVVVRLNTIDPLPQ